MVIPEQILAHIRRRGRGQLAPLEAFTPRAHFRGDVFNVPDGDGLYVNLRAGSVSIRLFGIDAPEWGQVLAHDAWKMLAEMTMKQTVDCLHIANDRYGRLVCEVFTTSGTIPALELLLAGLAWHSTLYAPHRLDYATAQKMAQINKKGIWKLDKTTAPWTFRAMRRTCSTTS